MNFYNRLSELCAEQGGTPHTFLKEFNISSGTLSSWKKGRDVKTSTVVRIADFFHVSVDYLLGLSDARYRTDVLPSVVLGDLLSSNESEMLSLFRKLSHDEQMRELGRMNLLVESETGQTGGALE